jgi:hypothetical protein
MGGRYLPLGEGFDGDRSSESVKWQEGTRRKKGVI